MAYFVSIRCLAPKNKKDEILQNEVAKFHHTTTEMTFDDMKANFQKIVDAANEANTRSKTVEMRSYAPGHVSNYENGSIYISEGNIAILCTHIKGYIRPDFAVQTQI